MILQSLEPSPRHLGSQFWRHTGRYPRAHFLSRSSSKVVNFVFALNGKLEHELGMLAASTTFHFRSFANNAAVKGDADYLGGLTFTEQRR